MDCSPPGSSVHGILQARVLEWVAIPFSMGSSQARDQTQVSCIAGTFFTVWATREAPKWRGPQRPHPFWVSFCNLKGLSLVSQCVDHGFLLVAGGLMLTLSSFGGFSWWLFTWIRKVGKGACQGCILSPCLLNWSPWGRRYRTEWLNDQGGFTMEASACHVTQAKAGCPCLHVVSVHEMNLWTELNLWSGTRNQSPLTSSDSKDY